MKKNFGAKPYLYPQPVLMIATYDKDGNPDIMNAAWGGISETSQITICLDDSHKTTKNLLETKAFTVSMATKEYVKECDYLGIVSGNDVPDKVTKAGFTVSKCEFVNAPSIDQLPMGLECKLLSYDEKTCQLIGEIVNVYADESVLTNNRIDPAKLHPITFDACNGNYIELGDIVGKAFSDGNSLK